MSFCDSDKDGEIDWIFV